jgi:hypothetical protein
MPLQFAPPNTYYWTHASPRPAKPQHFSQELVDRFLQTKYATTTTLANFIQAHPNALNNGVLNQLHRRHVISWDLIKRFTARAAAINFNNQEMRELLRNIFEFFVVRIRVDPSMPHGPQRANAWTEVANHMCWVESNVFVGPSAGNVGVAIDQGDQLTDAERRDLLAGTVWRGAAIVQGQMEGVANA